MATASLEPKTSAPAARLRAGRHVLLWMALWVIYELGKALLSGPRLDIPHLIGPVLFGLLLGSAGALLGEGRTAGRTGKGLVLYWMVYWAAVHAAYCFTMVGLFFVVAFAMGVGQAKLLDSLVLTTLLAGASGAALGFVGGLIRASRATPAAA